MVKVVCSYPGFPNNPRFDDLLSAGSKEAEHSAARRLLIWLRRLAGFSGARHAAGRHPIVL